MLGELAEQLRRVSIRKPSKLLLLMVLQSPQLRPMLKCCQSILRPLLPACLLTQPLLLSGYLWSGSLVL